MKKWMILLIGLLLLGGCGAKAEGFHLSASEQETYAESIDKVMEDFYWEYDYSSLSFGAAAVPEATEENERLFAASSACDYNLKSKAGQTAVLAQASLLHYNGDVAGTLQCWFVGGSLAGVAYSGGYDNGYYSLEERNPFLVDGEFSAYEGWTGMPTAFREAGGEFSAEGIYSVGQDAQGRRLALSLSNGRVEIYRYANELSRYRSLSYGQGLEAVSAVFLDASSPRLAVLISGRDTDAAEEESSSARVLLYDEGLQVTGEIPLEGEACTALGAEENKLYLFIDKSMEIYEEKDGTWQCTDTKKLRHRVTQCHITDLDGNGVREYILSDGMDLYLYHALDGGFRKLWSTHLGIENFYGPIMSGDLNGDGVKEIYTCDTTATGIRYILTERGLQTANEDIAYGQCIYPCDFDGNGREDYWLVQENESRKGQLYLAAEESK